MDVYAGYISDFSQLNALPYITIPWPNLMPKKRLCRYCRAAKIEMLVLWCVPARVNNLIC